MYWCFSGILPFLLVQGPALGSSSSSGCWIKSTNLADRMYWRTRLKERSFTFCKTNKTPHLHTSSRMERQTHWEKHNDREILTRHSLRTMKLVNWPGQCWRYLDTFSIRMSYLLLLKEQKMLRKISPGGTKREGVGLTDHELTCLHRSVWASEEWSAAAVLKSLVCSETACRWVHDWREPSSCSATFERRSCWNTRLAVTQWTAARSGNDTTATQLHESPTWKSIRADLSVALPAIELGPLFPTRSKSRRWVSNQGRSRCRSTSWNVASEMPRQRAFGHI